MPLSEQAKFSLKSLIIDERFEDLDLSQQHVVDELCQFVQSLQISAESLQLLEILIMGYGLPIIIYARTFYHRASTDSQFLATHQKSFMKLATLASQWTDGQPIELIDFMYKSSRPIMNPKPISKSPAEDLLIRLLQELQRDNKQLKQCTNAQLGRTLLLQYRNKVTKIITNDSAGLDLLMKSCLQMLILSNQQLNALEFPEDIQSIQINENQQTPFLDRTLVDLNSILTQHPKRDQLNLFVQTSTDLQDPSNMKSSAVAEENKQVNSLSESKLSPKKNEQNQAKKFLCCRSYFFAQQTIIQKQGQSFAFLWAPFPFKKEKQETIRRIICSFLNKDGGILFIGFENKQQRWVATGSVYLEKEKQSIKKSIRQICQTIQPDILTQKMYQIEFVPVRSKQKSIRNYVTKVGVRYGARDQIYSYKHNNSDFFPFRCGAKIIEKEGRKLMQELNTRVLNPLPIPPSLHPHPCNKPDFFGSPHHNKSRSHQKKQETPLHCSLWMQKQYKIEQRQVSSSYQPHGETQVSPFRQLKNPQIRPFQISQQNEKQISMSQNPLCVFQKFQNDAEKQEIKWVYFYCCNLTKKQLAPIFERKGIDSKAKIEQSKSSGIIIKASDKETVNNIRKICSKLEQKYSDREIKFYELSLVMEVGQIERALNEIKDEGIEKIQAGLKMIKFKHYKDSLQAFMQLARIGIGCKFIQSC